MTITRRIMPLRVPAKLRGFLIELLHREQRVVLMRKWLDGLPTTTIYEVMVVRVVEIDPKYQPKYKALIEQGFTHYERLPSNESWGIHGWTYRDLNKAKERFELACKEYTEHVKINGEFFDGQMVEDLSGPEDFVDDMPDPNEEMPEP